MMQQCMGVVMLLIAAVGAGYLQFCRENDRIAALRQSIDLIVEIQRSIELFGTPMEKLLPDTSEQERLIAALAMDGEIMAQFFDKIGREHREETLRLCTAVVETLEGKLAKDTTSSLARFGVCVFLPAVLMGILILLLI